jgi:hypothetical protein
MAFYFLTMIVIVFLTIACHNGGTVFSMPFIIDDPIFTTIRNNHGRLTSRPMNVAMAIPDFQTKNEINGRTILSMSPTFLIKICIAR